jgi:YVTN family beta-propeller protein
LSTGPILAIVAVGPDPNGLAVDGQTGRVFVTDHVDGSLRVLDAGSGALLGMIPIGRDGPMVVDERLGRVFLAGAWNGPDKYGVYNDQAIVRVLDARTGHILRTIPTGMRDDAVALALDAPANRVLVIFPGTILILDTQSGAVLHTVAAGRGSNLAAVDTRTGRAFVVNSGDNSVSVLDVRQGSLLRTVGVGTNPAGMAVDETTQRVFIPAEHGVSVLDALSGVLRQTIHMSYRSDAIVVDGRTARAFLARGDGTAVSMLDTRSGAEVGSVRPIWAGGEPHVLAVDGQAGRVFVGEQGPATRSSPLGLGRMTVLDEHDGTIMRTLGLDDMSAMAIDPQNGHIFVLSHSHASAGAPKYWKWLPAWLQSWLPGGASVAHRAVKVTGAVTILDATK